MKYKKPDGTTIDFPQVTGVPVLFQTGMGQSATIAFPVKAGDGCLIIVGEQSLDYWMYGQETSTDLAFDMTNAMCIPGLFAKANPVVADACAGNAVIVDVNGTRITVKNGAAIIDASKVTINGDVQVNGKVTASGDVKANSSISLATHTHGGDSGGSTTSPR
jgi:phage baseplate assembly protein gpV